MTLTLFLLKKGWERTSRRWLKYLGGFACIHVTKHADMQAQISALLRHLCGS